MCYWVALPLHPNRIETQLKLYNFCLKYFSKNGMKEIKLKLYMKTEVLQLLQQAVGARHHYSKCPRTQWNRRRTVIVGEHPAEPMTLKDASL